MMIMHAHWQDLDAAEHGLQAMALLMTSTSRSIATAAVAIEGPERRYELELGKLITRMPVLSVCDKQGT